VSFKDFLWHSDRMGMRRRNLILLLVLNLLSTLFEGLGLAMLLPIAQLMTSGGDAVSLIATSRLWQWLAAGYATVGLQVSFGTLLITCFVLMLVRQSFVYARAVLTASIQHTVVRNVRNEGLLHFYNANIGYIDRTSPGRVVNNLTTELGSAVGCIMSGVAIANYSFHALAYGTILFVLSPAMTLSVCAVAVSGLFMVHGLLRRSEMTGREITAANQAMSSYLVEHLKTVRLVKLSGMESAELDGLRRLTARQRDSMVGLARLTALAESLTEPAAIGMGLALLFAGYAVFGMGLPELGLFLVILLRLIPIIKTGILTWQSFVANLASLRTIVQMFDQMTAEAEAPGGGVEFAGLRQGIALRNVTFQYSEGAAVPALNDIGVEIPAARMTGLVGPSGSGKSTLVDILPRLREPQAGKVLFDGRSVAEFSRASLRRGISYAPQSPQIFDVTAAQHIRYGKADATDAEVERAARLAGAHEIIGRLPHGYGTPLGEGGTILSGGQRQRLDLARALVRQAPILILDEPTSNLDADAEDDFRKALRRIRDETATTIIIIGHRLSTIREADQIVVLQDGKVTDVGTHNELLARPGWYAEAHRKQHSDPAPAGQVAAATS